MLALGGRGAEVVHYAVLAGRLAGLADTAAVQDQEVREDRPVPLRDRLHEVPLYLLRVVVGGEPEPVGEPPDVGVDHDALVDPEGVAEHHVGGLAPDAWQGHEVFHGPRALAAVVGGGGGGAAARGGGA